MRKLILGSILVTAGLLLGVMLYQWTMELISGNTFSASGQYSGRALISGAVADIIRAVIVTYLYQRNEQAGVSLTHAVWFGLLTSFLVATLYVFYQYGAVPGLGAEFLISKTVIIILQGVLSGIALWTVFRNSIQINLPSVHA